jgi:hypothetical protein
MIAFIKLMLMPTCFHKMSLSLAGNVLNIDIILCIGCIVAALLLAIGINGGVAPKCGVTNHSFPDGEAIE